MRRVLPVTPEFHGARSFVRVDGRRMVTPMLVVMVAIGSTDLLFALDSIPAIFGLTQEPFLVFTANAFALMGLRQLYFLLGGLLTRLVYLSYGLAVILGFIGVKLVLEALHENNLPFLNDGQPVPVPTVGILLSLSRHHRGPGDHHGREPGQGAPRRGRRARVPPPEHPGGRRVRGPAGPDAGPRRRARPRRSAGAGQPGPVASLSRPPASDASGCAAAGGAASPRPAVRRPPPPSSSV